MNIFPTFSARPSPRTSPVQRALCGLETFRRRRASAQEMLKLCRGIFNSRPTIKPDGSLKLLKKWAFSSYIHIICGLCTKRFRFPLYEDDACGFPTFERGRESQAASIKHAPSLVARRIDGTAELNTRKEELNKPSRQETRRDGSLSYGTVGCQRRLPTSVLTSTVVPLSTADVASAFSGAPHYMGILQGHSR